MTICPSIATTQYSTLAAVCDERHTDSATFSRMTTRTVYVELLGEDVDVWRPVEAIEDGEAFVLPPTSPEGERWRFRPGSRVRRELSDGQALVAAEIAT